MRITIRLSDSQRCELERGEFLYLPRTNQLLFRSLTGTYHSVPLNGVDFTLHEGIKPDDTKLSQPHSCRVGEVEQFDENGPRFTFEQVLQLLEASRG